MAIDGRFRETHNRPMTFFLAIINGHVFKV
jgi:hypothetical protein